MKVVIVGAGIGGLGAAIALNRAGHDVEVYESSAFLNEVGAAIHIAPNASRVMESWDCDFETLSPVECEAISTYSAADVKLVNTFINMKWARENLGINDRWVMVHRVDLHNALRSLAETGFQGRTVKIHLKSRVESVDAEAGEVHFQDGRKVRGDLVIGADGLHSRTVQAILASGRDKVSTGQKVFRFLVPVKKAERDPSVKSLLDKIGLNRTSVFTTTADERMIIYPCRSGTLLNCAVLIPASDADDAAARETSWLTVGSLEDLVARLGGFDPAIQELGKMAEDLKLWSLVTRDPPPTFVKGKLALLGDAAHPMLPHLGQGGAQAIEDAGTLGALFPADTAPGEVGELLKLYNEVRYDHTVIMCISSRVGYDRRQEVAKDVERFVPNATWSDSPWYDAWTNYPVKQAEHLLAIRREKVV